MSAKLVQLGQYSQPFGHTAPDTVGNRHQPGIDRSLSQESVACASSASDFCFCASIARNHRGVTCAAAMAQYADIAATTKFV